MALHQWAYEGLLFPFLLTTYLRGNSPTMYWIFMGWCSVLSSPTDLSKLKISGLIKSELLISLFSLLYVHCGTQKRRGECWEASRIPGHRVTFSDAILKDNLALYFVNLCPSTCILTYLCGYDALIPFFCYHKDRLVHWIPRRAYRWYPTFWLFTKAGQREKNVRWLT